MSERLRGMARIRAVQKTLADLADWRLAAAARAEAEAADAHQAMQRFLAEAGAGGELVTLAGRTAARLAVRETEAGRLRSDLHDARVRAATRLRLTERSLETLTREEADLSERKRLQALVEAVLARPRPPQPGR